MLTPAQLTILGLLIEQPRHGYDLEQVIEQRGIRQWTDIGFSSIYYLLGKLDELGLVSSGPGASAKARRVYAATEQGRRVAAEQAAALISEPRGQHPILIGLANLSLIEPGAYQHLLQLRLAALTSRIDEIEAARAGQEPLPHAAGEVFSYSLHLLQAERQWLQQRLQHRENR